MIRKIKRKIDSIGLINTIHFVILRVYHTIFNSRDVLYRIDFTGNNIDDTKRHLEVYIKEKKSLQEITPSEKKSLMAYGGKEFLEVFERRLKAGNRLFLAYKEEEIAGACWIYIGGGKRFYILPLSSREFMFFANFTIDKYRRQGVATTLFVEILNILKADGFQRGFIFAKEWNLNRKAIVNAGFILIGKFHEIKVFNRNILIWSFVDDRILV